MAKARAQRPTATATATETAHGATFTGVKVFSATMVAQRERLGETVSEWLAAHSHLTVVDIVVAQSSDSQFHCISISVFYDEPRNG